MQISKWWNQVTSDIANRTAFISSILVGMITHGYMLTNKMPNGDDMVCFHGIGGGAIFQGRWLLGFMSNFRMDTVGDYSEPFFNGFWAILLIACSGVLVNCLFSNHTKRTAALIGAALVAWPTITIDFRFMFLAHYHAFAILLMTIGAYCIARGSYTQHSYKKTMILIAAGAVAMGCSMGIYQAFFPYGCVLLILGYLKNVIQSRTGEGKALIQQAVLAVTGAAAGMCCYFLGNACMEKIKHFTTAGQYGSEVGEFHISQLPAIIRLMYLQFWKLFTSDYHGLTNSGFIRIIFGVVFLGALLGLGYLLYLQCERKNYIALVLSMLVMVVYPLAVELIYLMVPNGSDRVYLLMDYATAGIILFPIMISVCLLDLPDEKQTISAASKFISAVTAEIVLCTFLAILYYGDWSNKLTLMETYAQQSAHSYYTTLITQIKSVDGYDPSIPIYIQGQLDDEALYDLGSLFPEFENVMGVGGAKNTAIDVMNTIEYWNMMCGYHPRLVYEISEQAVIEEIAEMPCYSSDGAIRNFGDVIVVKFAEQ